jgi:hypothetical protein
MPQIILSLDAYDMLALYRGLYVNNTGLPTPDLLAAVEITLADLQRDHGEDAALVRLDFLDDGTIHVLASGDDDAE